MILSTHAFSSTHAFASASVVRQKSRAFAACGSVGSRNVGRRQALRSGILLAAAGSREAAAATTTAQPRVLSPEELARDIFPFDRDASLEKQTATATTLPLVLLPGFGNNLADYTSPFYPDNNKESVVYALESRGFSVTTVPIVERKDWFNVARALFTWQFWAGCCTADQGYRWYMDRVDATVKKVQAETGATQVNLVAHSAGGWLARAYLADPKYGAQPGEPNPAIRSLVSLGTPHINPPADVMDMTRGALKWVNESYPGAFFKDKGVRYVCVTGQAVRGNPLAERYSLPGYAASSYGTLLGEAQATAIGDAVVPCEMAILSGAEVLRIDGVLHSMSKVGTWDEPSRLVWYGHEDVVDHWLGFVV